MPFLWQGGPPRDADPGVLHGRGGRHPPGVARWIIEDYEDNLFLSRQYGYFPEDFNRQWFHWGGFSNQSNLLLFPPLYLWRDQPKHYLRCYFNAFTSAYFPVTLTMCEHALPTLDQWRALMGG